MEEWTQANRQTPNYQSPAAPRTNPFAVKPVTAPARAAVSDHPDYDGDEWYTPPEVMTVVRAVLGGINLDPASCAEANRVVCADGYYDKTANGLSIQAPWKGTVYLNPPYSQPLIGQFVDKFIEEYEAGRMTRGIMLVNNCTETGWFAALATRFPVMFGSSRIKFYNPKYEAFQTRQGQAYFYAGDDVAAFFEQMSAAGLAYAPNRILIPGEAR
jgi:phage N-6-adenine-methyltransferase